MNNTLEKIKLFKEYQFIGHPQTTVKLLEIFEVDNDEVYLRYLQTDTKLNESYEDWRIIKLEMFDQVFEDIPKEEGWTLIEDELPTAEVDIKGYSSEDTIHYVYRCGHAPRCMTWKCSLLGATLMVDIIKWKYIN